MDVLRLFQMVIILDFASFWNKAMYLTKVPV